LSDSSVVVVPMMFVLARAATYSAFFIGLLLMFLPDRILSLTGIIQPPPIGARQVARMLMGASGAALALTCILTFAFVGIGTPAPLGEWFESPGCQRKRGWIVVREIDSCP